MSRAWRSQQARVGARHAVFRQHADRLKQCRAEFIVQIFRGQLALTGNRQASAHIGGELRDVPVRLQRV
jgi:hypothetical protein